MKIGIQEAEFRSLEELTAFCRLTVAERTEVGIESAKPMISLGTARNEHSIFSKDCGE